MPLCPVNILSSPEDSGGSLCSVGPTDLMPLIPSPQRTFVKPSNLGGRKLSVILTGLQGQQVVLGFYLNCLEQQEVLMELSIVSERLEKLHDLPEPPVFLL